MMKRVIVKTSMIVVALFACGASSLVGQTSASSTIQGTVVDQAGVPIEGVSIIYRARRDSSLTGAPPNPFGFRKRPVAFGGVTQTGAGGLFRIEQLAEGEYVLCAAFDDDSKYLDGCMWGQPATIGSVGDTVKIEAAPAGLLDFRVEDPNSLVRSTGLRANLTLGVFSDENGWYYGARPDQRAGSDIRFKLRVPLNQALRVSADSSELRYQFMGDSLSRTATEIEVSASASASPVQMVLQVTGLKAGTN